jgi:amino acid transporter
MSGPRPVESGLVRSLGTVALAASVVNITVGAGIFRLPADMAATLGATAPLAYLLCAIVMGLIVLCMAEAGSRVALTGGPYAFVETAFGPFPGFLTGFMMWMLLTAAMAAVSTILVANLGALVPALAPPAASAACLVVVYGVFATINILGVERGARLNTAITLIKILPLLLLVAGGLFAIEPEHFAVAEPPSPGTLARSSLFLIFAFAGVETALLPSGEVRDPARTVPRAILIGIVVVTLLYAALQFVAQGVLGPPLAEAKATPLADAAGAAMGAWARQLLIIGAIVSMLGYVGAMTLAVPRTLFAFGRDGFLPAMFARTHPRYHTPVVAIVVQCVLVLALAITSTFERLVILTNIALLVLYGMCCLATWQLRRREVRAGGTPFRVPVPGLVIPLACAAIGWLLTSVTLREWAAFGLALLAGSAVFLASRRNRLRRMSVARQEAP